MSETKALLPALRFPEFREAGPWVETTIGDVGSFYYGKSAPKWSLEENAPTPCVRYGELYTRFGATITETYSRTNIEPEKLRFSKGGEVLVPRVGERPEDFGKCCSYLPMGNIAIGEMISVFETAQNPLFYTYYFRNLYAKFAKVVEGQNVKNLYYAQLEPLKIGQPTLPEQQKIADCLTSLDDLITTQGQKVAALERHKKGLMQQLFPAPGQTTPALRFPEFREAGPWEEKRLGDDDVSIFVNDRMPREELRIESYVSTVNLLPDYAGMAAATKLPPAGGVTRFAKNDILMSNIRPYLKKICLSSKDGAASNDVIVVRAKKSVSSLFLSFLLMNDRFVDYVMVGAKGVKMPRGDIAQMKEYPLAIPKPPEQQKIAACLTSLDNLIRTETQKLTALGRHKKGLMQQLFPNPDGGAA